MRNIAYFTFALLLATPVWSLPGRRVNPGDPVAAFQRLDQQLAGAPENECQGPSTFDFDRAYALEDKLFQTASEVVEDRLNAQPSKPITSATDVLKRLQGISRRTNAGWLPESQFHFQILSVPPALVVGLSFRGQATFFTYMHGPVIGDLVQGGKSEGMGWSLAGTESQERQGHSPYEKLRLYALHRGPSHDPRFLSVKSFEGCAGAGETVYIGYAWWKIAYPPPHPFIWERTKILDRLSRDPGESLAGKWWRFSLGGGIVRIPYCWDGGLLMSAWATICSVDTYDLRGDLVRYVGTRTNRPDWAVVASVIRYAQKRDIHAVRGYCTGDAVARRVVALMPPGTLYFAGVDTKHPASDKEVLDFSDGWDLKFTLDKVKDRWLISAFAIHHL